MKRAPVAKDRLTAADASDSGGGLGNGPLEGGDPRARRSASAPSVHPATGNADMGRAAVGTGQSDATTRSLDPSASHDVSVDAGRESPSALAPLPLVPAIAARDDASVEDRAMRTMPGCREEASAAAKAGCAAAGPQKARKGVLGAGADASGSGRVAQPKAPEDVRRSLSQRYGRERPRDLFGKMLPSDLVSEIPTLVEVVAPTALEVRGAVTRLCAAFARLGLPDGPCSSLEMVLAEALNNIAEHAYADREEGWIAVELELLEDWVIARISDGGDAMPGGRLPSPRPHDLKGPLTSLPEGGFGWLMIHDLTTHLTYKRLAEVNCLAFALPTREGTPVTSP